MTSAGGFSMERSKMGEMDVFELHGELDMDACADLEQEVHAAICLGASRLLFDLAGLSFIDSRGLQVLVGAVQRVWMSGGGVWVVGANERTMRVFEITGLTRVFTVAPTRDAALAAAG